MTAVHDRQPLETAALEHLWLHSNDLEWDELTHGGLRVFVEGHGATLTDVRGGTYLDGLSGLFVVAAGHGRTEIADAMATQARKLAYTAASNAANPAAITLAEKIASLTPGDLDRVFLCSGGSEAVESAMKIAKQVQAMRGFGKRYKIIARRGSYHGTTFGAASLTGSANEGYFGPFMAGVSKVPSPNHYRNDFGLEGEAGDIMCARFVEQEILTQGPEHVAAVIGEPISVANGTHLPGPVYWQMLREICDRYGVLLIMDEVITGWGRTGAWFAAEHYGVVPDLMTMAKGLSSGYAPIAAVAARSSLFDDFRPHGRALNHLITFGGHAVAAAAALKNIEILEREHLVERSAEMGTYLFELAQRLRDHPTVGDVRGGQGLLCAIDFVKDKETKQAWGTSHPFIKFLALRTQEEGLVTRVWDVLHLAPPFVLTRAEAERAIEIVDRCLTEAEHKFADEIA
ncbi:aminotransferase family protein [Amycolatopsis tucumanensis]|uniref:Aminotransferase class III-fold pyridoxal phosphate-dependent enzyme n=1 Tax=Amycolatopsis tucumanensis TaxID=401106 RepID=A0ABP7HB30_9PSEU|nr:aminotransferase class III-fold pyridoxal phosphate-dependent enzyme [Amycolatopsis tucumanensis]MCF6421474.1 aminotransferase class III-fold pyridoxal phosphate-dependent enzyme [Amycolatopsis tucumanensis]